MTTTTQTASELYSIPLTTIDGQSTTLTPYKGKVLLVVNVASRCGFTPQYAKLEELQNSLHNKNFSVLGFPCNQFLNQESKSNDEIKSFVQQCYKVTFPMFAKLNVRGKEQHPLYNYLARHIEKPAFPFIPWNFTKILINADGHVLKRYPPTTSLNKIKSDIEALL